MSDDADGRSGDDDAPETGAEAEPGAGAEQGPSADTVDEADLARRVRQWFARPLQVRISELLLIGLGALVVIIAGVLIFDGFQTSYVLTKLIALIAALLVIMYSARQRDTSIKALGLLVVATLIVSPIDALRMWSAVQQTEQDWEEESYEDGVVAGLISASSSISDRTLRLLTAMRGLDPQFSIYADQGSAAEQMQARGVMDCALEAALAEEIYNALRGRDSMHWLTGLMDNGNADAVMSHATDRRAAEYEFDLLDQLGLISFPADTYHLAVITPRGWHLLYIANRDRARIAQPEYNRLVSHNPEASMVPFVQVDIHSPRSRQEPGDRERDESQAQRRSCWEFVNAARNPAPTQSLFADPFGPIPDPSDPEVRRVGWRGGMQDVQTISDVELGEDTVWLLVSLSDEALGTPYSIYRVDVRADGDDGRRVDPMVRVFGAGSEAVLAQNDDAAFEAAEFDPSAPRLGDLDSRVYFVEQGYDMDILIGVRPWGMSAGQVDIEIARIDPVSSVNSAADRPAD